MLKKIAVFNHKGGVSKTTTSFNLGWSLARNGKRVVLVDADSQCNLTLYALGYTEYQNFYETSNEQNINDALAPAYKSQPKLIEPVNCIHIPRNNNVLLLPGHLNFSENEVQLGISMQLSNAFGAMKNLPGAFNYLITETAQKFNAEYVIVDMNPSLSAINQDILISCNYFIVPTSPDFFSVMAIRSLSRIVPTWEKWAKNARGLLTDSTYPIPFETPKFLGYTINDFNLSAGRPQRSFREIMDRISKEIKETFVPSLDQEGMILDKDIYIEAYKEMASLSDNTNIEYNDPYCLAEVSNFNKLIAISNKQSVPVFELELDLLDGQRKTLNWFKFLYNAFANRIIRLVENQ